MPVVGIVRGISTDDFKNILPIYIKAGFTTIEVTMNTNDVESLVRHAIKEYPDINVGTGTVCSLKDLEHALNFGSQFIVSPIINYDVIKTCVKYNIPVFPGALTPTEIYNAWDLGASIVKVYPAANLGAGYIKDVKGPLNRLKLMPTGGIGLGNIQSFLEVGVDGLGIGSPLFDKSLIKAKNWSALENHFSGFTQIVKNHRKKIIK
ncbi:bifunctional 4-hydroxy-2-oxoglutarate aldolase/2-dehydro-3-deoxy-phosphogluconate aldolase [Maribellus maritimus]|uniref:bifunctional 4-hydroxy-2-oxoglutarate aldolase/2-dehydro-3-deoxy-phosphogluconate aldolase n=1 Tax=Maribellus maritimus TaxID=2870838 RepID=UPI001EE9DEB3|nr:bifunctional 4-hydroxy-2-oxoglutarate aldolase/2-dehydro-3-deoxy-phosphogluconate aldolase [Maribellus maritimus]MCG6190787.1 bifunctional 4-hydroxy-2-oxoglutarate aldolase/2-dehydro-3-deoxy-phosphogluconate aldolase [Maribellus maritimus]